MAKADSIIVNDNKTLKNTKPLDLFIEPHIFMNLLLSNKSILDASSTIVEIDARYDFRPDRLAYEQYRQDFWYPAILIANNMGSLFQFKAEVLNFKCKIPDPDVILGILNQQLTSPTLSPDSSPTLFK